VNLAQRNIKGAAHLCEGPRLVTVILPPPSSSSPRGLLLPKHLPLIRPIWRARRKCLVTQFDCVRVGERGRGRLEGREREIYQLKERAVSNPTLHPPPESQSCMSCYITLCPAAALFPVAREPKLREGQPARSYHRHSLMPALPRLYLISCSPAWPAASRSSRLLY